MHYSGPMQRVNRADANAKIDEQITKLRDDIKGGDDDLSSFSDRNPYNTFELMQKAQSWRQRRYRLEGDLASLQRRTRWSTTDTVLKPPTPTFLTPSI